MRSGLFPFSGLASHSSGAISQGDGKHLSAAQLARGRAIKPSKIKAVVRQPPLPLLQKQIVRKPETCQETPDLAKLGLVKQIQQIPAKAHNFNPVAPGHPCHAFYQLNQALHKKRSISPKTRLLSHRKSESNIVPAPSQRNRLTSSVDKLYSDQRSASPIGRELNWSTYEEISFRNTEKTCHLTETSVSPGSKLDVRGSTQAKGSSFVKNFKVCANGEVEECSRELNESAEEEQGGQTNPKGFNLLDRYAQEPPGLFLGGVLQAKERYRLQSPKNSQNQNPSDHKSTDKPAPVHISPLRIGDLRKGIFSKDYRKHAVRESKHDLEDAQLPTIDECSDKVFGTNFTSLTSEGHQSHKSSFEDKENIKNKTNKNSSQKAGPKAGYQQDYYSHGSGKQKNAVSSSALPAELSGIIQVAQEAENVLQRSSAKGRSRRVLEELKPNQSESSPQPRTMLAASKLHARNMLRRSTPLKVNQDAHMDLDTLETRFSELMKDLESQSRRPFEDTHKSLRRSGLSTCSNSASQEELAQTVEVLQLEAKEREAELMLYRLKVEDLKQVAEGFHRLAARR